MMPSIFSENLIDGLMNGFMDDFSFPAVKTRKTPVMKGLMRTDVRELENGYVVDIDLPGYKKEDIKARLKDGCLEITASCDNTKEEKDEEGKYLRRERYCGSLSRSFYVGESITEEDIHAKFENGILTLSIPKEAPQKPEEARYVCIEG